MTDRASAIQAFLERSGWSGAARTVLAGDASFRRYDRVTDGDRIAVLMDAPPPMEDVRPFIRIAEHLTRLGYSAPRILARDIDRGLLLLEDLGDSTYTKLLAQGHDEEALYALAMDMLADLHARPDALTHGLPKYDESRLLAEAALLTDWYYPTIFGMDLAPAAKDSYMEVWRSLAPLARALPDTLVLRDFHVDNLMLLPRRPGRLRPAGFPRRRRRPCRLRPHVAAGRCPPRHRPRLDRPDEGPVS